MPAVAARIGRTTTCPQLARTLYGLTLSSIVEVTRTGPFVALSGEEPPGAFPFAPGARAAPTEARLPRAPRTIAAGDASLESGCVSTHASASLPAFHASRVSPPSPI